MRPAILIVAAVIIAICGLSFDLFAPTYAYSANLYRPYDPVVVQGAQLTAFLNAPVAELYVYAYKNGDWTQIPFQIDEKDGTNDYYGLKNGVLDSVDEICFMAADMGDSVADWNWIDNAESRLNQRYQVGAQDTLATPPTKSWAYIYQSGTLTKDPTIQAYMSYVPAPVGSFSDTVKAKSYVFGNNAKSIPDYLSIRPAVGGSGIDIMDRWKIRISGKLFGMPAFAYSENEDTGLQISSMVYKAGPVRVIRLAYFHLALWGAPITTDSVAYLGFFYPHAIHISAQNKTLDASFGVEELRQSVDYLPNIAGAKFHSPNNSDITVDGNPDVVNKNLTVPGINWFLTQGAYGTVATIVDLPVVGDHQELFYKDSSAVNPSDTGDSLAYGDSGVRVTSSTAITGTFGIATNTYYLEPHHTPAIGDSLAQQFANPLAVSVMPREFVLPVELANFAVRQVDGGVELAWITASESKNYGFEIERRSAGTAEWQRIGFVKGSGTTSQQKSYSFQDQDLQQGTYLYRLKQIDTDGSYTYSAPIEVTVNLPQAFHLGQNYPNPFNPTTEIVFQIPASREGLVSLKIFNLVGQEIRTLLNAEMKAGSHRVLWDGRDAQSREVVSGVYVYRLQVGSQVAVRKMIKLQ